MSKPDKNNFTYIGISKVATEQTAHQIYLCCNLFFQAENRIQISCISWFLMPVKTIVVVVVEPLVYFAFLFVNETVITKTQGLVVAIAKREYINKSK